MNGCVNKSNNGQCNLFSNEWAIARCVDNETCVYRKPRTNADMLLSMDGVSLAVFLNKVETDGKAYGPKGKAAWLNWLKQEVSE